MKNMIGSSRHRRGRDRPRKTSGGYARNGNDMHSLGGSNARSYEHNRNRHNRGPERSRFEPYPSYVPPQPRDPAQWIPQRFEQLRGALPTIMQSRMQHEGKNDIKSGHDMQLDPAFPRVMDGLRVITQSLGRDLRDFDDFRQRLVTADTVRYGKPRISVCGDSGQGKSRLIGALLSNPGLVVTSDSGEAGTRVPIEYKQLKEGAQGHKYEFEIVLMTWDKFHDRVERSLLDLSHGLGLDDASTEDATEVVLATLRLARNFFQSLFWQDSRFQNDESMKILLKEDRNHIIDLVKKQYITVSTDRSNFVLKRFHNTSTVMWKELFPWTFG